MSKFTPERSGTGRRSDDCIETCNEHSGMVERDKSMVRWLEGIFAIGAVTAGLLSYSVIWQAPNIRADIAKEISRIDKENVRRDMKLSDIDKSVCDLTGRITYLEDKRK